MKRLFLILLFPLLCNAQVVFKTVSTNLDSIHTIYRRGPTNQVWLIKAKPGRDAEVDAKINVKPKHGHKKLAHIKLHWFQPVGEYQSLFDDLRTNDLVEYIVPAQPIQI